MGNGCGLQMDGFSTHFEPSKSISFDFNDFGHFGVGSDGLMLFPGGPRPSENALKLPGPVETVLQWADAASGRSSHLLAVS